MSRSGGLNRRAFLRSAGTTAVIGAIGAKPALGSTLTDPRRHPGIASPVNPQYDFDEVYDRIGWGSIKWDRAIEEYGSAIQVGMGIADTDFRSPPCVTTALAERCAHENWGYLHRTDSFNDAVVEWNQKRYGLEIDPDTLVWIHGVHPGVIAGIETFAPPGSRVLMNTPTYNGFYTDLTYTRTIAEDSPMKVVDGRYEIDWEDFELRAQRSNVFILCNPQNPTGNCWSPDDLMRMGEICLKHSVPVLADEIHCDFVNKGHTYTPFASLPDKAVVDNSLTFKSASKSFSLASMKVAWYFSTNPAYLERVKANTRASLPTLGMAANEAALKEGEDWLDQQVAYLDANHDFTEAVVRERVPLVEYTKAEGTFLAWLDVSALIDEIGAKETAARESATSVAPVTPEKVAQRWFAQNAGVYLNVGAEYGTGGAGRMRMNLGTSRKLVELALNNMAEAIGKL